MNYKQYQSINLQPYPYYHPQSQYTYYNPQLPQQYILQPQKYAKQPQQHYHHAQQDSLHHNNHIQHRNPDTQNASNYVSQSPHLTSFKLEDTQSTNVKQLNSQLALKEKQIKSLQQQLQIKEKEVLLAKQNKQLSQKLRMQHRYQYSRRTPKDLSHFYDNSHQQTNRTFTQTYRQTQRNNTNRQPDSFYNDHHKQHLDPSNHTSTQNHHNQIDPISRRSVSLNSFSPHNYVPLSEINSRIQKKNSLMRRLRYNDAIGVGTGRPYDYRYY